MGMAVKAAATMKALPSMDNSLSTPVDLLPRSREDAIKEAQEPRSQRLEKIGEDQRGRFIKPALWLGLREELPLAIEPKRQLGDPA
jgi:hypothetical protein